MSTTATPNGHSETVAGVRRSVCIHCGRDVWRDYPEPGRWSHITGELRCKA